MSSSTILWELQRELETKANGLSKLQRGKPRDFDPPLPFFALSVDLTFALPRNSDVVNDLEDIAKNHEVRKKYTVRLGENELVLKELDLLKEDADVYKLIGPVLVKQDLAEANANVRKRIDYISTELKRLDATIQDLAEQQNGKRYAIFKLQQRIQSLKAGKEKA